VGCAPAKDAPRPVSASVASPPRLGAVADAPTFGWSDKDGNRVAQIRAESGAATGATGADTLGELTKGTATLFQNNKAVATVTADKMKADQAKRTLTATGNVITRSLRTDAVALDTLRADTVLWNYDTDRITGRGNVTLSKANVWSIPATSFSGNTDLQNFLLTNDGEKQAVGNF
ncbi:MAG: LPS export ABC transporter periplasmic protein LptC, partial [Armatimonadetes bacterium]|nr:LPS export ABC transporter periplasmic protein LptC [Armatimonadota bacterium]